MRVRDWTVSCLSVIKYTSLHPILILFSHLIYISPNWFLPFRFSEQILYEFLISPMYATSPVHLILLYFFSVK